MLQCSTPPGFHLILAGKFVLDLKGESAQNNRRDFNYWGIFCFTDGQQINADYFPVICSTNKHASDFKSPYTTYKATTLSHCQYGQLCSKPSFLWSGKRVTQCLVSMVRVKCVDPITDGKHEIHFPSRIKVRNPFNANKRASHTPSARCCELCPVFRGVLKMCNKFHLPPSQQPAEPFGLQDKTSWATQAAHDFRKQSEMSRLKHSLFSFCWCLLRKRKRASKIRYFSTWQRGLQDEIDIISISVSRWQTFHLRYYPGQIRLLNSGLKTGSSAMTWPATMICAQRSVISSLCSSHGLWYAGREANVKGASIQKSWHFQ